MEMGCRKRGWLGAVLAAVCLVAALPRTDILAREQIDQGRECSLTVKTEILVQDGEEENPDWVELDEAEIQVYLYRVAEVNNYGEYTGTEDFEGLELEKIDSSMKADDWREMAREAAGILGLPIPPKAEDADAGKPGGGNGHAGHVGQHPEYGQIMENPDASEGMELPGDLPDKLAGADAVITLHNGSGLAQGLEQGMYLVWVMPVETDSYQYTFLPYLVSLPNNSYDASVSGSVDEWEYETTVGLKPRQNMLYGGLRISKALNNYNEALGEAMFVFRIEARKDLDHDGEKEIVYSNVVGLEFNAPGRKEAVIEHIPAGSQVTVEEVYSGSAYTIQGDSNIRQITVWPKDNTGKEAVAEFTNDYDGRVTYGTGAINRFSHDGTGWSGSRVEGNEGGGDE